MNIRPVMLRSWSKLGQRGTFFGVALPDIAEKNNKIKLLTADLALLSGMDRFVRLYPEKFLNVGIAEQNMVGIASGLAMEGYTAFATTYASFIAVRSLEHIRQHLSHLRCNVKIIGTSAGVVAAKSGVSHWATEDLAFMRALPGLTVLSAADALEAYKMAVYAAEQEGPMYIRLSGGTNCSQVYMQDYDFIPGNGVMLKEGTRAAILATGLMVSEALKAAQLLEERGINCSVVNFHTIKPLDKKLLDQIFANHDLIVTAEEHNIIGGLGSAVAEYKATKENTPRQIFVGFPDSFAEAGNQKYIWGQKGMLGEQISNRILAEYNGEGKA